MPVTDQLKQLRNRSGMSMDALAKEMGYKGASSIQRYEDPAIFKKDALPFEIVEKLVPALAGKGDPPIREEEVWSLAFSDTNSFASFMMNNRMIGASDPSIPYGQIPTSNGEISGPVNLTSALTIPVYGQAIGGDDGQFVLNGNHVADVLAPPALRGVRGAYGVYVAGESMEPRYFAGEVVYVDPTRPVRRGDFVVVQIIGNDEDDVSAYVKRFISMNSRELTLEQYNPEKKLNFPYSRVKSVHRVVMGGEG